MKNRRMIRLLSRYLAGRAGVPERARVDKWYDAFEEDAAGIPDTERVREELYQRIHGRLTQTPLRHMGHIWVRAAAAVLIVSLAGGGLWVLQRSRPDTPAAVVKTMQDVKAPSQTLATITLGNGRRIALDSIGPGQFAAQGGVKVEKLTGGRIVYQGRDNEIAYNTVTVPRGSRIVDLTLADGTRVWLNSESSLRYPTAFAGKERRVEVTGEAYFKVAENVQRPFIVEKGGLTVQVLGTEFNVNTYADEGADRVTLISGAVRVSSGGRSAIVKPGQQVVRGAGEGWKVLDRVDLDAVTAWKDGRFQFGDATDVRTIMRQVARWYNVDIAYRGDIEGHIGGAIGRDVDVSQVLKMLELTGAVHFRIEGRTIIVMP